MPDQRRAYGLLLLMLGRQALGAVSAIEAAVATIVLPVALVAAMDGLFTQSASDRLQLISIGALLPVIGTALWYLPGVVGRMRERDELTFYAGLPVTRLTFIAALLTIYGVLTIPGIAITAVVAANLVPTPLHLSLLALLVTPLAYIALAGLGLCLGVWLRTHYAALLAGTALAVVSLAGLAALLHPFAFARWQRVAELLPAGLAARAADAFLVPSSPGLVALEIILLLFYAAVGLFIIDRALPWRVDEEFDVLAIFHPRTTSGAKLP